MKDESITLTFEQVLEVEATLNTLASRKLSMGSAVLVSRMLRAIKTEAVTFREMDRKNVQDLGVERDPTPDEIRRGVKGSLIAVTDANMSEYKDRTTELLKQEIEIRAARIDPTKLKSGCPECRKECVIEIEPRTLDGLWPVMKVD